MQVSSIVSKLFFSLHDDDYVFTTSNYQDWTNILLCICSQYLGPVVARQMRMAKYMYHSEVTMQMSCT